MILIIIRTNIYHNLSYLCKFIASIFKKYNVIFGTEYIRSLGNAMRHGRCPLECKIKINNKKCTLTIKDSGQGFDFKNVIRKFHNNEIYYKHHGLGMKTLLQSKYAKVKWSNNGNKIKIKYKTLFKNNIDLFDEYNIDRDNDNDNDNDNIRNRNSECNCKKCKSIKRRH